MLTDTNCFTIVRDKWSCGLGKNTKMLDDFGQRDCIGFFLQASGLSDEQLLGLDEPIDVLRDYEWVTQLIKWEGSGYYQTPICNNIIRINDSVGLTLIERESQLIELFGSIGVTLIFTD